MKGFLPVFLAVLCGCSGSKQADNPKTKTTAEAPDSPKPQAIPTKPTSQATKAEPKPIPAKSPPKATNPAPQPIPAKPKPPSTPPKAAPKKPSVKTTKPKKTTPTTKPAPKTTKIKPPTPTTKNPGKDAKKKPETSKGRTLQQRWALLAGAARQGQWPNYQIIQQNLGRPNQEKQNVTMNTKAILGPSEKSVINPQARALQKVAPCIRWDYFDSPKGQDSIQLYFFNGALAGFHWVKKTKKNQGNKTASKKTGNNKAAGKKGDNKPISGTAQNKQLLQRRWALLAGTVSRGQWPNYQVIQQNLGQPNQQKQNVTMNTRAILNSKDKGAVNPGARTTPTVFPCIRWDYFGAPNGEESIQLYFFNGSLAGFQWVKNTKKNQGKNKRGKAGSRPR